MRRFQLLFSFGCIFAMLALVGCVSQPCDDILCENGHCVEGDCQCDAGYEGLSCTSVSRSRLLGDWEVGDICRAVATVYDLEILEGPAINEIIVNNLNQAGQNVQAIVDGVEITVPNQTFGLGFIYGTGGIDILAETITLEYTIDDGNGNLDVCQASFTRP